MFIRKELKVSMLRSYNLKIYNFEIFEYLYSSANLDFKVC
jgi:hypothetical protein